MSPTGVELTTPFCVIIMGDWLQKYVVLGLMLATMSLLWWSALVFLHKGEYYDLPRPSLILLCAAGGAFAYSLKDARDKDPIERYYWRKEDL